MPIAGKRFIDPCHDPSLSLRQSGLRHVRKRRGFEGRIAIISSMTIDGDAAYQVLLAHDARFDGRLFVGVTSTGVYCRPICRVRMPARRNCRFFATPAQAEAAAFRPCLSCRPEIAPGPGLRTVMDASRTLALQAATTLDEAAASGETPSVAELAERLGVSDRHSAPRLLRRAWRHALAVSADPSPPARQATSHGHADADRSDRTDERIREPAPLQCRVRRRLSDGPMRLRRASRAWHDKGRRCSSRRRRADHGDARLSRAARRARVARVRCPACHSQVEVVAALSIRRSLRDGAIAAHSPAGWIEARFLRAELRVRLAFAPRSAPAAGP